MSVIVRILDLLFPPRESERSVRGASADDFAALVSPVTLPLAGGLATALLPYRGLAKDAVIEAKYHGNRAAMALLGGVLAEYLLEFSADEGALSGKLALVPMPLSAQRRRDRGYNQVERICEAAMARLGGAFALMPSALLRIRDTAPQTRASGEGRRTNMRGAFAAAEDLDASYTYIVVDDVITTGATMAAATEALRSADARVIPLALAR